jgi:hypothetical protein
MKVASILALLLVCASRLSAQHEHHAGSDSSAMIGAADASMNGPLSEAARKHLAMSPMRRATNTDSARALDVADQLRMALAKYADTSAAVADGYRMFAPQIKQQRVYHFTNYRNAFMEAFRFDPDKPTSILYRRGTDGRLELIGAMYSAPKRMSVDKLDQRVPLSIARWHKHVNWCVPKPREKERWFEQKDGHMIFGPESPIATKQACEDVGGLFLESPLGWMLHANVFLGEDLATIYAHDH